MTRYDGPCQIACPLGCAVPDGVVLSEVPDPRHAWGDVIRCPNDEVACDKVFLIVSAGTVLGMTTQQPEQGDTPQETVEVDVETPAKEHTTTEVDAAAVDPAPEAPASS